MIDATGEFIKSITGLIEDKKSLMVSLNLALAGMEVSGKPYESDSYIRIRIRRVLNKVQLEKLERVLHEVKDLDIETMADYLVKNPIEQIKSPEFMTTAEVETIEAEFTEIKNLIGDRRIMKLMLQLINPEHNTGGAKI
jgi:hypothetical protein